MRQLHIDPAHRPLLHAAAPEKSGLGKEDGETKRGRVSPRVVPAAPDFAENWVPDLRTLLASGPPACLGLPSMEGDELMS
jgi:hypothetical protein